MRLGLRERGGGASQGIRAIPVVCNFTVAKRTRSGKGHESQAERKREFGLGRGGVGREDRNTPLQTDSRTETQEDGSTEREEGAGPNGEPSLPLSRPFLFHSNSRYQSMPSLPLPLPLPERVLHRMRSVLLLIDEPLHAHIVQLNGCSHRIVCKGPPPAHLNPSKHQP